MRSVKKASVGNHSSLLHLLCGPAVDERPLGGVRLRAVTQPELGIHGSAQLLHEAIVDPALNQEPVGTDTRLQV